MSLSGSCRKAFVALALLSCRGARPPEPTVHTGPAGLEDVVDLPYGTGRVRWLERAVAPEGCTWVPGPTDSEIFGDVALDLAGWKTLEDKTGPGTTRGQVRVPERIAENLFDATDLAAIPRDGDMRVVEGPRIRAGSRPEEGVPRGGGAVERHGRLAARDPVDREAIERLLPATEIEREATGRQSGSVPATSSRQFSVFAGTNPRSPRRCRRLPRLPASPHRWLPLRTLSAWHCHDGRHTERSDRGVPDEPGAAIQPGAIRGVVPCSERATCRAPSGTWSRSCSRSRSQDRLRRSARSLRAKATGAPR